MTVENLLKKYRETWGKDVDFTISPKGITQEDVIPCLELMIADNLSLLQAYNVLKRNNR